MLIIDNRLCSAHPNFKEHRPLFKDHLLFCKTKMERPIICLIIINDSNVLKSWPRSNLSLVLGCYILRFNFDYGRIYTPGVILVHHMIHFSWAILTNPSSVSFLAFNLQQWWRIDRYLMFDVISVMYLKFDVPRVIAITIATEGRLFRRSDTIDWNHCFSLSVRPFTYLVMDKKIQIIWMYIELFTQCWTF